MSPQSRRTAKSRSPKTSPRDTETTETQPAAAEAEAEAEAMAIKPPAAFPLQVPLETGLSDYGMWCEMFGQGKHPPLPKGERRGRIWG
jgi:cyanobactin cluster PatC/TenC/TruC protein